jgi:hypothetical protein
MLPGEIESKAFELIIDELKQYCVKIHRGTFTNNTKYLIIRYPLCNKSLPQIVFLGTYNSSFDEIDKIYDRDNNLSFGCKIYRNFLTVGLNIIELECSFSEQTLKNIILNCNLTLELFGKQIELMEPIIFYLTNRTICDEYGYEICTYNNNGYPRINLNPIEKNGSEFKIK